MVLSGIVPLLAADQDWALPVVADGAQDVFYTPWFRDWLWPHQREAVRAGLLAPAGRGILEVPTGGGKTRIAAALGAAGAAFGGARWLYVCPNKELLLQSAGTLDEGATVAGVKVEWTFSTYSSLDELEGWEFDGLICDEVHRAAAAGWSKNLAGVRACWRIGMSGTPLDRTDDKNSIVIGLTGPVVYTVELQRLQREGRLADGSVEVIEVKHE